MKNFSGIVAWYSADRIPGILSFSSNISISLIFILNSKIALVFKTEIVNWTANEESSRRVSMFSFGAALWFRRPMILFTWSFLRSILWFDLLAIFTVKWNDSVSFFSCFLVFFFVKDQITSFQLQQIIVFLNLMFRVCVYFIAWLQPSLII